LKNSSFFLEAVLGSSGAIPTLPKKLDNANVDELMSVFNYAGVGQFPATTIKILLKLC
jgi:hypothetical protein